jgi:hypothetical protein
MISMLPVSLIQTFRRNYSSLTADRRFEEPIPGSVIENRWSTRRLACGIWCCAGRDRKKVSELAGSASGAVPQPPHHEPALACLSTS